MALANLHVNACAPQDAELGKFGITVEQRAGYAKATAYANKCRDQERAEEKLPLYARGGVGASDKKAKAGQVQVAAASARVNLVPTIHARAITQPLFFFFFFSWLRPCTLPSSWPWLTQALGSKLATQGASFMAVDDDDDDAGRANKNYWKKDDKPKEDPKKKKIGKHKEK